MTLYLNELQQVRRLRDPALRKPNFAYGKQEHNVHHKVDELAKRHYRRVTTMLDGLYQAEGFDLLVVGGHPHEVSAFTDVLPRPQRDRLAGTFTIDARTATANDVGREAQSIMDRYERDDGGTVEHVATDTDLRRHVVGALLRFPLPPTP
jgi:peptide chain release factor subunit 1